MKKGLIIGVVALLVIAGVAYALMHKKNNTSNNNTSNSTAASSNSGSNQPATATITYSNNGFSPSVVTVKSGGTVAIKNTSSKEVQFDSDPHPVHTDDTDLNAGSVAPGQTVIITVVKTGTFGYHNHLSPSEKGQIIVQ